MPVILSEWRPLLRVWKQIENQVLRAGEGRGDGKGEVAAGPFQPARTSSAWPEVDGESPHLEKPGKLNIHQEKAEGVQVCHQPTVTSHVPGS